MKLIENGHHFIKKNQLEHDVKLLKMEMSD